MRLIKDIVILTAIQTTVTGLWALSKIDEAVNGYLWNDERYKMPNWYGDARKARTPRFDTQNN